MFQKIRERIFKVRGAYRALFLLKDSGQPNPAAEIVLADLRRFCRASAAPAIFSQQSGMIDPIATGVAIGRQEVWHRIAQNLHLSDRDLIKMMEADAERDQ